MGSVIRVSESLHFLVRDCSHITSSRFWPFWTPTPPYNQPSSISPPPPFLKDLEMAFRSIIAFQNMENSHAFTNINSTFFVFSCFLAIYIFGQKRKKAYIPKH